MLGHQLVLLSDAHLGAVPASVGDALLAFLDEVPRLGDSLLINGDLFDFWFSYRRAIPRDGFRIAAALAALRRRIPVAMTGGNHDRWGDSFWEREARIAFSADRLPFRLGRLRGLAIHGDGLTETRRAARLLFRVTRHPLTAAGFRSLPPDLGFWLVDRLRALLADPTREAAELARVADRQREWAEQRLRDDPELDLLVLGHTHRACLTEPVPGRRYVNPGAWFDGMRYAVVTEGAVTLHQF